MWLREDVLTEMVTSMLPALTRWSQLTFAPAEGDRLACPSCREVMTPAQMHGILVDRCDKHGIWFDPTELEMVLRRTADPDRAPILGPGAMTRPDAAEPSAAATPRLRFWVRHGESVQVTELAYSIIKIGRIPSSHLRLPDESGASRMHAIIEALDDGRVQIIDLGTAVGTRLNGERVNKADLVTGDVIGIGDATIEVEIVGSATYRQR
jgi:Zn-finger nucleic acid-binding protein